MDNNVKRWFLRIGLLNAILAVIGFFLFTNLPMEERLILPIISSVGYFIFFGITAYTPSFFLGFFEKTGFIYRQYLMMFKTSAIGWIGLGILISIVFIVTSFTDKLYHQLLLSICPLGISFGGIESRRYLKSIS